MESPKNPQEIDRYLEGFLEKFLANQVQERLLKDLNKSVFPCSNQNVYKSLLEALSTYYFIKLNKGSTFEDITKQYNKKCEQIGHGIPEIMKRLFQTEFLDKFKSKFSNPKESAKIVLGMGTAAQKEQKIVDDVIVTGSCKPKDFPKILNTQTGSLKSNNSRANNNNHSSKKTHHTSSQVDYVNNLSDRGVCLCEKEVGSHENSFLCIHCNRYYHLQCMKKKAGTRHCSMCHLKRIIPNKQVKKVLFVGLLKKSKKKHQFTIYLSEEDLSMKYKLQVRSIRLKDITQYFILFPDSTNIVLNNYSVKEFKPLHRQSSLKYRKDEPFIAEFKHLLLKENKIVIHEQLPSKQSKDERIDVQNHLIGFFMVEDKKIEPLVKEISNSSTTTFEESKKVLDAAFRMGSLTGSEDLSCQVVKIPLLCTLSTDRISIPARGLFCTHYNCFDLHNYIIATSSTSNPKWVCPICRQPCYEFKVDSILKAILAVYADERITEVMFFKNGQFTVHAGDRHIQGKVNNISALPIDTLLKRAIEPAVEPQKRRRKTLVIPQNINVISLD